MKHGIYSEMTVVDFEEEHKLVAFGKRMWAELAPIGELELRRENGRLRLRLPGREKDDGRGRPDALTLVDAEEGGARPGLAHVRLLALALPRPEPHATIRYVSDMRDLDRATVRLRYSANGVSMNYLVRLVSTLPRFGGRRWWFLCPLARKDGGEPRRVANLHLPPGGRYFGSRKGYGLTYRSSQENGAHRGLFKRLAAGMGTDEASIRRALRR